MHPASANEILIERLVDAPRERVWEAWTNLEHLEKWWGPNGFSVTTESFAFETGGEWIFLMHGPDGRDYPNKVVFTEIVEPERIAHDHGGDDGKVEFKALVTFEARGDKTLVTMRSTFPSQAERDRVEKEHHAVEGGKQTLGRMAEYVLTL
jgi:uncharacterized protein YndB with AHSA1/START domain